MHAGVQIAAFTDFGHAWNYKNEFKFSTVEKAAWTNS